MAATITDLVTKASNGTRPIPTTLTAIRSIGATSISCGALTGWPTDTPVHFSIYRVGTDGKKVAGSQTDWKGIVSGNTITSLQLKAGSDNGDSVGAVVQAGPTAAWADDIVTHALVSTNQNGTLKSNVVSTANITDTTVSDEKRLSTVGFYATTTQSFIDASSGTVTTYTEVADYGADFDPTTGVFTAPYTGFYHFDVSMRINDVGATTDGRIEAYIQVNGVSVAAGFNTGQTISHDPAANVAISIPLTAADAVKVVFSNNSGATEALNLSFFSGYLIGRRA